MIMKQHPSQLRVSIEVGISQRLNFWKKEPPFEAVHGFDRSRNVQGRKARMKKAGSNVCQRQLDGNLRAGDRMAAAGFDAASFAVTTTSKQSLK